MNFKAFQRFLLDRGMVYFYTVFVAGYLLLPTASALPATWLATLRDGGLVGLAFLVSILAVELRWAWGLNIAMDYDRLLVHPKEIWLLFWQPVALIMAAHPVRHAPVTVRYPGHKQ
jgi:hypothetical protein